MAAEVAAGTGALQEGMGVLVPHDGQVAGLGQGAGTPSAQDCEEVRMCAWEGEMGFWGSGTAGAGA